MTISDNPLWRLKTEGRTKICQVFPAKHPHHNVAHKSNWASRLGMTIVQKPARKFDGYADLANTGGWREIAGEACLAPTTGARL